MSIPIYKNTKIFVATPAAFATGGTELLHQLVYHLRNDLNLSAFIYYIPTNHPEPVHKEFEQYRVPFVREIEDKRENLLIVPEVFNLVQLLNNFEKIRKAIWWLSVDNFYTSLFSIKPYYFPQKLISKIGNFQKRGKFFDLPNLIMKYAENIDLKSIPEVVNSDYHLVQSEYARQHLFTKGITKIYYLSDYLNEQFLKEEIDTSKKENIVAYNPKKGFEFTQKIMKQAKNIKFIPIENMSRMEVISLLEKAKVYIDFGNHPGKDRIPREAAIKGCCIILGKKGSAKFKEDTPIPDDFKFENQSSEISNIIGKIDDCLNNYELYLKDFEEYRDVIKSEPQKFIYDLKNIFVPNTEVKQYENLSLYHS